MTGWTVPGYTETASLGSGATGRVVSAVEDATGAPVAIKYLNAKYLDDEAFLERFRAEAELLAGLDHPNVVKFHRYLEAEGGGAALVMELVPGATLRKVLKSAGPVSPEAALSIMRGSLLGLDAAHTLGIVHRDYKPSNVLLTEDGVSKLADFGIAERAGTEMPAIGTPSYMAPEQWEGAPAEPVTDIYAVTASFYEALTGHVPYSAETVFELEELHRTAPIPLADVPPAVRGLVAHGLAKDAGMRPADVRSFIAELEEVAISEYGVEWEEEGRRNLAVFVWPLSSGSAGGPSGGEPGAVSHPDDWFDGMSGTPEGPGGFDDGMEEAGRGWRRVGPGTKAGLTAAAVAVVGSVAAAVAFGSGGTPKAPVAGSTGVTVSAAPTSSVSELPTPTLQAGVNAPTPGTPTPTPTKTSSTPKPTPTTTKPTPSSPSSPAGLPSQPPTSSPAQSSAPSSGPSSQPSSAPSTPPPTTSSPSPTPPPAPSIVGRLALIKAAPASQACPPADLPTYQESFVGHNIPAGTTISITYSWRLAKNGGGGKGEATVTSTSGGSATFSVGSGTMSPISDTVIVSWTASDGESGTNSAAVTLYCKPIA